MWGLEYFLIKKGPNLDNDRVNAIKSAITWIETNTQHSNLETINNH